MVKNDSMDDIMDDPRDDYGCWSWLMDVTG